MKNTYLTLAVLGFIAPNVFVAIVTIETGNFLLYLNPIATINGMFANKIATAFVVDLLFVVLIFFVWSHQEAKKVGMKTPWLIWILTMLLGLAGALPLFLYQKEVHISAKIS